jgi:hypothetical protein
VTRGSRCDKGKGGLLPVMMAWVRCQKGAWVAVVRCKWGVAAVLVRMEAGTHVGGMSEWWGR